MDNYFTSFHLLTHFGVNSIQTTGVLNKNRLCKCNIIGDKQLQKKERGQFEQRSTHQAKKQCNLRGWIERQQGGLHNFFWILPT